MKYVRYGFVIGGRELTTKPVGQVALRNHIDVLNNYVAIDIRLG